MKSVSSNLSLGECYHARTMLRKTATNLKILERVEVFARDRKGVSSASLCVAVEIISLSVAKVILFWLTSIATFGIYYAVTLSAVKKMTGNKRSLIETAQVALQKLAHPTPNESKGDKVEVNNENETEKRSPSDEGSTPPTASVLSPHKEDIHSVDNDPLPQQKDPLSASFTPHSQTLISGSIPPASGAAAEVPVETTQQGAPDGDADPDGQPSLTDPLAQADGQDTQVEDTAAADGQPVKQDESTLTQEPKEEEGKAVGQPPAEESVEEPKQVGLIEEIAAEKPVEGLEQVDPVEEIAAPAAEKPAEEPEKDVPTEEGTATVPEAVEAAQPAVEPEGIPEPLPLTLPEKSAVPPPAPALELAPAAKLEPVVLPVPPVVVVDAEKIAAEQKAALTKLLGEKCPEDDEMCDAVLNNCDAENYKAVCESISQWDSGIRALWIRHSESGKIEPKELEDANRICVGMARVKKGTCDTEGNGNPVRVRTKIRIAEMIVRQLLREVVEPTKGFDNNEYVKVWNSLGYSRLLGIKVLMDYLKEIPALPGIQLCIAINEIKSHCAGFKDNACAVLGWDCIAIINEIDACVAILDKRRHH